MPRLDAGVVARVERALLQGIATPMPMSARYGKRYNPGTKKKRSPTFGDCAPQLLRSICYSIAIVTVLLLRVLPPAVAVSMDTGTLEPR